MNDLPDIVIGSGPSGVSVATARLAKGRTVLMLDAGQRLEAQNQSLKDKLGSVSPSTWDAEDVARYQAGQFDAPKGAIRKFGSDFAVQDAKSTFKGNTFGLGLRASRALGGLSNVWGASVLPSAQSDITDWPITSDDLSAHYQAVSQFVPIAGRQDKVGSIYAEFSMEGQSPLPFTPQTEALLERVDARDGQLGDVTVGAARNAAGSQCVHCGLCLHGCPYDQIWSSRQEVDKLRKNESFTYQDDSTVMHLREENNRVFVTLEGGETVEGNRLFVASGVLETARLYLRSFTILDTLELLDSQHFFTPFLHHWNAPRDPETEQHHTLSGAFAEFIPMGSTRLVHSQLYTWNAQYKREMMANYGSKIPLSEPLFNALSRRLIVAQSFLHSDYSGRIGLQLDADQDRLVVETKEDYLTKDMTKRARKQLSKALRKVGLHALSFAGHSGAPGSSFHVGGSLGMAKEPQWAQTDVLGRLKGLERVHAVDASVMTSIPASTITFTVMANAHRIGVDTPE